MNTSRKVAVAAAASPMLLIVVILMLVAAIGGGLHDSNRIRPVAVGQAGLNTSVVPEWALRALLEAADTCQEISAPLLAAQIEVESQWNPNAYNERSQATGLSQFLPSTWEEFGIDGDFPINGEIDPRDPDDAIATQARYMCHLVEFVYDNDNLTGETVDLALAGYNAGPGNVQKYGGIPPFQETTDYVRKIRDLANNKYAKRIDPAGDGTRAELVIQAAADHVGRTMYAWGGGTLNGPSGGSPPDQGVTGFDCSSLVRFAYYQGTGQAITLPRTSREQFAATRAQSVAVNDLQPGDLLFWGTDRIHHVALYIGNNRMIEAPQSGSKITETNIRLNGDFAGATRVFN